MTMDVEDATTAGLSPVPGKTAAPLAGSPRLRTLTLCAVLALAVLAVYLQTVGFDFAFDDDAYITENSAIHGGLTWEGVRWAFSDVHLGFWHPLTLLSHMLDVSLFGLTPGGHHLTAVLLHLANTILCFLVLQAYTGSPWSSALAAALFALHPLRAESVAYISERKDVLSTLFWFLTMASWLGYVRRPSARRYLAALGVFALGLMAKPMLVTLPFALLLLDYWPLRRLSRFDPRLLGRLSLEKIPFLALSGAASALAYVAEHRYGALTPVQPFPFAARALNALYSYGSYLWKTLWPADLAAFYPHPGSDIPLPSLLASAAALALLTVLTLRARRGYPFLAVGWFWFLGTLLPVIGLVQIGDMGMADRFTYVPSVGLFIALAWAVRAWAGTSRQRANVAAAAAACLCLALALASYRQTRFWRDNIALFSHAVSVTGVNPLARFNLGVSLFQNHRLDEAERELRTTLAEDPGYLPAYNALSGVLYQQGRPEDAIAALTAGLARAPRSPRLHHAMGELLMAVERNDEASPHLEEALRLRPQSVDFRISLGVLRARQGRLDEARRHFLAALALDPSSAVARANLQILQTMQGGAPSPAR